MKTSFPTLLALLLALLGFTDRAVSQSLPFADPGPFPGPDSETTWVMVTNRVPATREGSEAPAVFVVKRSGRTDLALILPIRLGGSATNGLDYVRVFEQVVIPAGASSVEVPILALKDELAEPTETVTFQLTKPPVVWLGFAAPAEYMVWSGVPASILIHDQEVASPPRIPPTINVVARQPETTEGATNELKLGSFLFSRTGSTTNTLTVPFEMGGTAQNGVDYRYMTNRVTFAAGHESARVYITPINDALREPTETVTVTLQEPMVIQIFPAPPLPYQVGSNASATVRIFDNNPTNPAPLKVMLTSPTNGFVSPAGEPIFLAATAPPGGRGILRVEFFDGEISLGTHSNQFLAASVLLPFEMMWSNAPAGQHSLRAQASDLAGTSAWSEPVTITVLAKTNPPAIVQRFLPSTYHSNSTVTVRVLANPPGSSHAYAVEDQPPVGWRVESVQGGTLDPVTRKVKFGPFTDNKARELTYVLFPISSEPVTGEFVGLLSADGHHWPITGDSRLVLVATHPADRAPADWQITIDEVTGYAAAWRSGQAWPAGPRPIPVEYVTQAGLLWLKGEHYEFSGTPTNAPYWWIPSVKPAGNHLMALRMPPLWETATAVRSLPERFQPGTPFVVTLQVTPSGGTGVSAVEERIPVGWGIDEVSDSGGLDEKGSRLRWGPFYGATPRTLSYRVRPVAGLTGRITFSGVASFDGSRDLISGSVSVTDGGTPQPPIPVLQMGRQQVRFQFVGESGRLYLLQTSSNLVDWATSTTRLSTNGVVPWETVLDSLPGGVPHFHRVIPAE